MAKILSTPSTIYIDITSSCNLNCRHCFIGMQKRVAMSKQIFKAIINQAAALNIFGIVISGGEPLLHECHIN